MTFTSSILLGAAGLFVGILACIELGHYFRRSEREGLTSVEGAVFALLGLLIAFTFSGAASRFEARRQLVGQEANAISTAYLRISTLPKNDQPELRTLFRRYLEFRVDRFKNPKDMAEFSALAKEEAALQSEIWAKAVEASSRSGAAPAAAMLLLPALNEMIDITTTRVVAMENHPPAIIFILLASLSLLSALLAGYGMARNRPSRLHTVVFAAIISITVFVILDLEYPRRGLIRVDTADRVLDDLLQTVK